MDTSEKSGKEPTDKWSNEVGVIVMRQVSGVVVERRSLEDSHGERNSGVECGGMVVGNLDQSSEGESHGQGLESTIV